MKNPFLIGFYLCFVFPGLLMIDPYFWLGFNYRNHISMQKDFNLQPQHKQNHQFSIDLCQHCHSHYFENNNIVQ